MTWHIIDYIKLFTPTMIKKNKKIIDSSQIDKLNSKKCF